MELASKNFRSKFGNLVGCCRHRINFVPPGEASERLFPGPGPEDISNPNRPHRSPPLGLRCRRRKRPPRSSASLLRRAQSSPSSPTIPASFSLSGIPSSPLWPRTKSKNGKLENKLKSLPLFPILIEQLKSLGPLVCRSTDFEVLICSPGPPSTPSPGLLLRELLSCCCCHHQSG